MALGDRQRGIWSVCCVEGAGDGQTISGEGTESDRRKAGLCSQADMSVDDALIGTLLFVLACNSQITYRSVEFCR